MVAVVIPDTAEVEEAAAATATAATTTADVIEAAEAGTDISVTGPVMDAAMAAAVVVVDDRVADTKAEAAEEEDAAHHGRRPTKHTECSPTSSRFSAILRPTVGPGWCIMPTSSMPSGGRRLDPTDRPSSE